MCLTLSSEPLSFDANGKRTCYKIVEKNKETGEYQSFFKLLRHEKEGWIHSDRVGKFLTPEELYSNYVSKGIHVLNDLEAVSVFLDKEYSVSWFHTVVVLEVECSEEDFVANGCFSDEEMPSSVWMKVWIKGEIDVPSSQVKESD